jgi:hypothetical protein
MNNWQLCFVKLSGWPVFIAIVLAGILLAWLASVP